MTILLMHAMCRMTFWSSMLIKGVHEKMWDCAFVAEINLNYDQLISKKCRCTRNEDCASASLNPILSQQQKTIENYFSNNLKHSNRTI